MILEHSRYRSTFIEKFTEKTRQYLKVESTFSPTKNLRSPLMIQIRNKNLNNSQLISVHHFGKISLNVRTVILYLIAWVRKYFKILFDKSSKNLWNTRPVDEPACFPYCLAWSCAGLPVKEGESAPGRRPQSKRSPAHWRSSPSCWPLCVLIHHFHSNRNRGRKTLSPDAFSP